MNSSKEIPTPPVYIPVIDGLRGVAALLVCVYHLTCTITGLFTNEIVLNFFSYGKYGVQMFFVISGIVIPLSLLNAAYTLKSWGAFLLKRIVRIEPPYLLSVVLVLLLLIIRNAYWEPTVLPSAKEVAAHAGYLIPFIDGYLWLNTVYWTLGIEFQYYLILSLSFPLLCSSRLVLRSVFYIFFVSSFVFFKLNGFNQMFFYWSPFFMLGIMYIAFLKKKVTAVEYWVMSALSTIALLWFTGWANVLMPVVTLLLVHFYRNYSNSITTFLGNISYSLYLTHIVSGATVVNVLSHYCTYHWQKIMVVIVGVIISILCAWLMYKFVELPSKKMAARIKYKGK